MKRTTEKIVDDITKPYIIKTHVCAGLQIAVLRIRV